MKNNQALKQTRKNYSSALAEEIVEARTWLSSKGIAIRSLESKKLLHYLPIIGLLWALVCSILAVGLHFGFIGLVISALLIGHIQRAMGNLFHDFSHGGFRNTKLADTLTNILLGWPNLTTMRVYRANHLAHHAYLGDPLLDPDFIHDDRILDRGPFAAYFTYLTRWNIWRGSLFGQLPTAKLTASIPIVLWWTAVISLLAIFRNGATAMTVVGVWFLARATSFHLITTFREMADHVGLWPGGVRSFSRNSPLIGLWRYIIHTFENGLHLAHHLFPRMPFFRIRRVHKMMLNYPYYNQGENCTGYFGGRCEADANLSVSSSLTRCLKSPFFVAHSLASER